MDDTNYEYMSYFSSLLKITLLFAPLFLCLYTCSFLQDLLFNCSTECYLWLFIESAQPLQRFQSIPLSLLQTRPHPQLCGCFHFLCLPGAPVPACAILHSAIWKHLSFSYAMGFHSLVLKQTVSSPLEYLIHIYIPSG